MVQRVAINNQYSQHFKKCWELYEYAFPAEERRDKEYHLKTMGREGFHFDAIVDNNDTLIGVVGWWEFEEYLYIEHLATLPLVRGSGYGRQILEMFKSESPKQILLEVELPEDELSKRRIEFYRREGFSLNLHHYTHPPYRGQAWVNLLIMTSQGEISAEQLERFKREYFPRIHFLRF